MWVGRRIDLTDSAGNLLSKSMRFLPYLGSVQNPGWLMLVGAYTSQNAGISQSTNPYQPAGIMFES